MNLSKNKVAICIVVVLLQLLLKNSEVKAQFSIMPSSQSTICLKRDTAIFSISQNNTFPFFDTISLASIVNTAPNPNTPPTGNLTYAGVPFSISAPNTSWHSYIASGFTNIPVSASIDIPCPKQVDTIFTLINTGWGETKPNKVMTFIKLDFTNGMSVQVPLDGNVNIRDHRQYNNANNIGSSINNGFPISTQKVWSTIYNGSEYRRDMQTITIPAPYNSFFLTNVTIIDSGQTSVHRAFITGLTIHAIAPAPIVWHAGSPSGPIVPSGPAPTYTISVSPIVSTTYFAVSGDSNCTVTGTVKVIDCDTNETGIINAQNSILGNNILSNNIPNPFNDNTTIKYVVTHFEQSAQIVIYDLFGRKIAVYPIKKGDGSVIVNGENLTHGVYLYSLVIDGYRVDTKRMVLSH
ncbi:MAG: T9SS type A sorting domain-containing protein [Flavipsychrobacter sp.]